ncbi:ABC-2 type transport system permease protein [Actinoalloteichus hoggarensis]|uniref:ABC-2 family transporter protein n=1 Tax=Actinoalloteichus hoggarensis TaxID=1470176 RepID=A0A221W4I7_9PSEU|nr:ABC transporter permease [Actinoalloteichus hoggarensis]ASO20497.1 ABC-2 family transporter protein [Actinoalloteichus hoggarensis]MBB5923537.1 ABC-2 type transport system permease protein [Actinoalloteichus hoggarensis]
MRGSARRVARNEPTTSVRFVDVLSAEFGKARTLPAVWIALVVAFLAASLLGALAATDTLRFAGPDGEVSIGQFGTLLLSPVYAFLVVGVCVADEYRAGQLGVSLAAVPNRTRLAAAKTMAAAVLGVLAAVPVLGPGHLLRHLPDLSAGVLTAAEVTAGFGASVAVHLLFSLIGWGFAVVTRSVVVPVATLFAIPILLSPMLQGVLPTVVRLLPHEAALSGLGTPIDPSVALGADTAWLVLLGWAGAFVAAACRCLVRRDVSGA